MGFDTAVSLQTVYLMKECVPGGGETCATRRLTPANFTPHPPRHGLPATIEAFMAVVGDGLDAAKRDYAEYE